MRSGRQAERDAVRSTLSAEKSIRFAGRVLADPVFEPGTPVAAIEPAAPQVKEPVLYSENLFVKFAPGAKLSAVRRALSSRDLTVKREIEYLDGAYVVKAPEGIGLAVFDLALQMLRTVEGVELCHPELLRQRQFRAAFAGQWHLNRTTVGGVRIDEHADVVNAWKLSTGKGITIAVIDTGIDVDHEEFATRGKILAPRDAAIGSPRPNDARPVGSTEMHGTACAGVACAEGRKGASGVAPHARLMPIRLMAGLGSQAEADAFAWAADNGADVISCSWGPMDGDWWDGSDPAHRAFVPLPDSTRLAIEHALAKGRGGKGCVICWAAGNGNESVDNDGYASHPGVIAVGACNDRGRRSAYSDTGQALWCAFPSDDAQLDATGNLPTPPPVGGEWDEDHPAPRTPGIWTTDRSGRNGYNRGGSTAAGDVAGHYTNSFGGTSSATPGVAGVAALVLALNPGLHHEEVKDLLKRGCDRIDKVKGQYDPGTGHSPLYGYGRVNAAKTVKLAARTVAKSIRRAKGVRKTRAAKLRAAS